MNDHIGGRLFDEVRSSIPAASLRRMSRIGCALLGLLVVVVFGLAALAPYTEYLWFLYDARQPQVFERAYQVRGTLFVAGFAVSLLLVYTSVRRALRLTMVVLQTPSNLGQVLATRAVGWMQESGERAVKIVAPIIAVLSALGLANEWSTFLLWRNAQPFGVKDPIFGHDLGFFVFTLPWYRALTNYLFGILLVTTVITLAVYIGLQALAALARVELGRSDVRTHIGLLAGATLLAYAAQTGLKCYEFGLADGALFTGAGYAQIRTLPVQAFLACAVAAMGVVALLTGRLQKGYSILIGGALSLAVLWAIGMVAYPFLVQRLSVEPNKLEAEGPFAERAIRMTRFAYGLDQIAVQDWDVQSVPTQAEAAASSSTLENMRLWDPEILRQALESSQGFRNYYSFNDVDVDRYPVGGKQTMVMLAPRDMRLRGLPESSRTWVTEHLQYTHGFGITMSPVNTSSADGGPAFVIKDLPPTTPPELPLTQPRIYFSDARNADGLPEDEYAIVDTGVAEFDYLADSTAVTHRWEGRRGIPIGGFLSRLAFSAVMADGNLLISGNVTGRSRLLIHRNVLDRASRVYPFLKFDGDPYIVLTGGRLVWVLDGYTFTDQVPYSRTTGDLNYIRNSVKVVIDAYSGEMTAYAILPDEPILRAYRAIYPGLIRDGSEISQGVREHFRYPEDLFTIQSALLAQYHVTNAPAFLTNSDAWERSYQVGINGSRQPMDPYYVQMRLPSESKDAFLLILPFTPVNKGNMSAWLAAHCDPENYGRLVLYRHAKGSLLAGPEQMEANFQQDPEISSTVNRQLENERSRVIVGNLLVIPIGRSVMYVEPIFLKSNTSGLQAIPQLKKVVLAVNGRVVLGNTYREALDKLFGGGQTAPSKPSGQRPEASVGRVDVGAVRAALDLLDQADQALRAGDFARYGELQKQARSRLEQLAGR